MRNPDGFGRPGPGFRHGPAGCQAATESTFLGAPVLSRLCLIDPSIEERRQGSMKRTDMMAIRDILRRRHGFVLPRAQISPSVGVSVER